MDIFRCEDFTIGKSSIKDRIIVERNDEFYIMNQDIFDSVFKEKEMVSVGTIKDNIWCIRFMVAIIVFTLLFYFFQTNYVIADTHFFIATGFLLFNILIHESGHMLLLKIFYKESKVKAGFKFVFIYPAFYVDTSSSYLLPKFKRMAIYMAGNVMNCLFVLGIMFFFPKYLPYCYLIVSNIMINFIPIIKSDGYYAFITWFERYNKKQDKAKSLLDDFIRGFIMFVLLNVLSFIAN